MPLAGLLDRRDLLRVGSLTLAAAAIPAQFAAGESAIGTGKAKSVI